LKSVRAHPPERDQEGFRRVREAYELLKDSPWLWQAEQPVCVDVPGVGVVVFPGNIVGAHEPAPPDEPVRPEVAEETPSDAESDEEMPDADVPPLGQELYAAMEREDFERAAALLLEAMSPATATGGVSISPWQVLECTLGLFLQGRSKLGGELLGRLEEWSARHGLHPGQISPAAAARWTLLKELNALRGQVEANVLRTFATAVKTGRFSSAKAVLEEDLIARDRVARYAPTLYSAARPIVPEITPRRAFFQGSNWSWSYLWVAFAALQGIRFCIEEPLSRRHQATESRATDVAASAFVPDSSDPAQLHFQRLKVEHFIDESVSKGDCNDVREQWPAYVAAIQARRVADDGPLYLARRGTALRMCPELQRDLPERP
jgi:hypothetical protein